MDLSGRECLEGWRALTYYGALGTATVALTFLLSGLRHLSLMGVFRRELRAHQLLPPHLESATAVGVTIAELLVGVAFTARLASDSGRAWQALALGGAVMLLLVFSLYLVTLLTRRPGVPCGCGIGTSEVSTWHLVRNALLLAAACMSFFQPPNRVVMAGYA